MKQERIRRIKDGDAGTGPIIYWMSRDQRAHDNWALHYTWETAARSGSALAVVFCLAPQFLEAGLRQYAFMLAGLRETEKNLAALQIPFFLLTGTPETVLPEFIHRHNISLIVSDFDPIRIKRKWKAKVAERIAVPFHEVDAHNIIPCWHASPKQEFAAYTFRPKVKRVLDDFLEPFPPLKRHSIPWQGRVPLTDWDDVRKNLKLDRNATETGWIDPGEKAGKKILRHFIQYKLIDYENGRNDPNQEAPSQLSPYLHFGQISAQKVAIEVLRSGKPGSSRDAFLEELIVRRELADNYCYYNPDYDNFRGFPNWAQKSLDEHRREPREFVYGAETFELGKTHDALWNAAQTQLVKTGKMHGYMRMYWAKKILEWTENPERAQEIAIYLNDRYELDGRDPNGYTGIAWSIGGVHDRAWFNRPIFGKVRFMSAKGARSKFDVNAYIAKMENIQT